MSERRKKILVVTYVYPPYAAVGVYRILKFCKYLPEHGYDPVILTPEAPNVMAQDEGLLAQVAGDIPVYRTPSWEPFRVKPEREPVAVAAASNAADANADSASPRRGLLDGIKGLIKSNLSVPDTSMLWAQSGYGMGKRAVDEQDIDLILSSSPPQSVHLLGYRLARRTRRPLIVDFRDLWTQNTSYHERKLPGYLQRRNRGFEKRVLGHAAGVAVNTQAFKEQILQNNAELDAACVEVVNNGVDPDDFRALQQDSAANDRFTMLYTGSIYGGHRNPDFFFAALRTWLDRRPELVDQIRVRFVGNWETSYLGLPDQYGLAGIVEKLDWMPQREALAETFAADLLLLFQGFDPVLSPAIPRKLYEYMVTNNPILAFAPGGEIREIIEQYDCGVCRNDTEPEPIIAMLDRTFTAWRDQARKTSTAPRQLRSMPELETSTQVGKLAQLCDRLLAERRT